MTLNYIPNKIVHESGEAIHHKEIRVVLPQ